MALEIVDVHSWDELIAIMNAGTEKQIKIQDANQVWDFENLYIDGDIPEMRPTDNSIIDFNGLTILRPFFRNTSMIVQTNGWTNLEFHNLKVINMLCETDTKLFRVESSMNTFTFYDSQFTGTIIDSAVVGNGFVGFERCGMFLKCIGSGSIKSGADTAIFTDSNVRIEGDATTASGCYIELRNSKMEGVVAFPFNVCDNRSNGNRSEYSVIEMQEISEYRLISPDQVETSHGILLNQDLIYPNQNRQGFNLLTSQQLLSPTYLRSIGFPCEGD